MNTWGDPLTEQKFWDRVLMVENCWEWLGVTNSKGYARFQERGRNSGVARWAYEHFRGPIPDGLVIDHLCRNRRCVNPAHLEVVTVTENTLRGVGFAASNAAKETCVHGHPLSGSNLLPREDGRRCRACRIETDRKRRARKRAALASLPEKEGA